MNEKYEDVNVDPEVQRRLLTRDFKKLTDQLMNRCLHAKGSVGPIKFYFNPLTSIASAVIIWSFVAWCVSDPTGALTVLKEVKTWVTDKWTWLYIGTQDVWALCIVALYFSKYSSLKLGKDDEKPEYSDGTYFTMLFSCGIGIGLFYYGVAEPIYHYQPGPYGNRYWGRYTDNQRAQDSVNLTLFHWGIHGWIVYSVIGLVLGFLCFRRGLPMTMRTCFYPILGDKIFGRLGDLIDSICVICTMFGVCTSLGLGAIQVNNGLSRLNSDIKETTNVQLITIWCVTALATFSATSGIKLGIKKLSEICFGVGCFIMSVILLADNTWYILNLYVQSIGYYFQWIIQLGFHTDAFAQLGNAPDKKEATDWMGSWTIFYWGWWISWSPLVGMFIAKISRGRTIKEFIFYTLTLPIFYTFFWFTIFGGVAIQFENTAINKGINCSWYTLTSGIIAPTEGRTLQEQIFKDYGTTMLSCRKDTEMWFDVMTSYGDIGRFMQIVSLAAIILYFVTSADSGTLVMDCLCANGHPDPPILQRIFWALTQGVTATALLKAGGSESLKALQTVSIACALPFTFVLNWVFVAMWQAVREEAGEIAEDEGRWKVSMWDVNTGDRLWKIMISILCPWFVLAKTRMSLEGRSDIKTQIIYSFVYALPFYAWSICMVMEIKVDSISYIGWTFLMFFFAFSAGLRGEVREKFKLRGNMVEDLFALILVYPLSCMQIHEQVMHGDSLEQNEMEMSYTEPPPSSVVNENDS